MAESEFGGTKHGAILTPENKKPTLISDLSSTRIVELEQLNYFKTSFLTMEQN